MHKWQVLLCSDVATAFISLILAQIPTNVMHFMSGLGGSHQKRPSGSHCIVSFKEIIRNITESAMNT